MADKIFPATKPTAAAAASSVTHPSAATKPQLHNAARPVYRSHPHRNRRSCYCYCCLWIIFILLLLLIISAIAAALIYLLYRPHRPSFSVSAHKTSQSNLTSSNKLTTRFNLTVIAHNPNKKIELYYDPVSVLAHSKGMDVGESTIPAFVAAKKSTSALKTTVRVDTAGLNAGLKSDLKENKGLLLKIEMHAKVRVKIASYMSKKARIRVVCNGVQAAVSPAGGSATVSNAKCEVDLKIKIWKWII